MSCTLANLTKAARAEFDICGKACRKSIAFWARAFAASPADVLRRFMTPLRNQRKRYACNAQGDAAVSAAWANRNSIEFGTTIYRNRVMEPTQVTKASLHVSHCAFATHSKQLRTHRQAQTQTPNRIVVFLGQGASVRLASAQCDSSCPASLSQLQCSECV